MRTPAGSWKTSIRKLRNLLVELLNHSAWLPHSPREGIVIKVIHFRKVCNNDAGKRIDKENDTA